MDGVAVVAAGLGGVTVAGFAVGGVVGWTRRDFGYLASGHAHNDYAHLRPLVSALQYGYASIEADVWPVDGELLVGHDRGDVSPDRTLADLYLDPLADRVRRDGHVYSGRSLQLLVEFKANPLRCYGLLAKQLVSYRSMLTGCRDGIVTPGAVTVVITGAGAPYDAVADDLDRYAFCDGSLAMADDTARPPNLVPLVSEDWTAHFAWRGRGRFPAEQRDLLHDMVSRAHAGHRALRFWALPERSGRRRVAVWRELRTAGVDYVGTDHLRAYRAFVAAGHRARHAA